SGDRDAPAGPSESGRRGNSRCASTGRRERVSPRAARRSGIRTERHRRSGTTADGDTARRRSVRTAADRHAVARHSAERLVRGRGRCRRIRAGGGESDQGGAEGERHGTAGTNEHVHLGGGGPDETLWVHL